MNQNLDTKGKQISNATQLSTITYMYTPTLMATNIEFSDVATSGASDLITKSGSTYVMPFNNINCI